MTLLIFIPVGRKMTKISRELQDETAVFTTVPDRALSEIRLVKASNAEDYEYNMLGLFIREGKLQAVIFPIVGLVMMGLLVIAYGGMSVSSGELSISSCVWRRSNRGRGE